MKVLPYAKSDKARKTARLLMLVPGAAGFLFGWIAALIALVAVAPLLWRQEHHFFFNRSDTNAPPNR